MRSYGYLRRFGTATAAWIGVTVSCASLLAQTNEIPPAQSSPGIIVHESSGIERRSAEQAREDRRLKQELSSRLEQDPWVKAYKLQVDVLDSIVTLDGKVNNLLARDRAVQLARTIEFEDIQNQIQVAVPARDDLDIELDVETSWMADPVLKGYNISADVENGNTILTGVVDSRHRKYLAETLAKSIPGVKTVENEIRFVLRKRSDQEMAKDVRSRIQWDPWLHNPMVTVNVIEGSVIITGAVESERAKSQIYKDAWVVGTSEVDVSGVKIVPNMISEFRGPLAPDPLKPTGRETNRSYAE